MRYRIQRRPTDGPGVMQREVGIAEEPAIALPAALYVEQASTIQYLQDRADGAVCKAGFLVDFGKAGIAGEFV